MQKPGLNLYFALFLSLLLSCGPATENQTEDITLSSSKIMNGIKADVEEFPEVIGIVSDDSIICSATAVRKKLLFTSAHCFLDFEEVQVEDGDSESFDELFGILSDDFCQSYQDCLEELNLMTWKSTKRRFLDDHLDEIIRLIGEDITIHQGIGHPGGEVESEDIVKEINFDPNWIHLIKLKLYETFGVLKLGQSLYLKNLNEYDEYAFDYAQIRLKRKVEASSLTPMMKEDELEEGLPDGSRIVLVGYGHQFPSGESDREDENSNSDESTLSIGPQGEEEEEEEEVEEEENDEEEEVNLFYGEKIYTTLPISGLIENESGSFVIAAGENEGACEGDSGGAAFIKFPNGKLKYIGIITAGANSCGDHIMWDTDSGSIQGNTIINVQLDTSEI